MRLDCLEEQVPHQLYFIGEFLFQVVTVDNCDQRFPKKGYPLNLLVKGLQFFKPLIEPLHGKCVPGPPHQLFLILVNLLELSHLHFNFFNLLIIHIYDPLMILMILDELLVLLVNTRQIPLLALADVALR